LAHAAFAASDCRRRCAIDNSRVGLSIAIVV
jgi:hypothetical protein